MTRINLSKRTINTNYTPRDRYEGKYPKNQEIKSPELLVITDDGESLGVIKLEEALKIAEERELDLIVIAKEAKPPVAKILSWSKFKYQQEKRRKENKGKGIEMKEMWFKSFIADGDLNHKLKKVEGFLDKKHPVKITIKAKGRVTRDNLKNLLDKIIERLGDKIEYDQHPKYTGRDLSIIVRPVKKITNEKQTKNT